MKWICNRCYEIKLYNNSNNKLGVIDQMWRVTCNSCFTQKLFSSETFNKENITGLLERIGWESCDIEDDNHQSKSKIWTCNKCVQGE